MFSEKIKSINVGTNLQGLFNQLAGIIGEMKDAGDSMSLVEAAVVYDTLLALHEMMDVQGLVHTDKKAEFEPIKGKDKKYLFHTELTQIATGSSVQKLYVYAFDAKDKIYLLLEMEDSLHWIFEVEPSEITITLPYTGVVGEA